MKITIIQKMFHIMKCLIASGSNFVREEFDFILACILTHEFGHVSKFYEREVDEHARADKAGCIQVLDLWFVDNWRHNEIHGDEEHKRGYYQRAFVRSGMIGSGSSHH